MIRLSIVIALGSLNCALCSLGQGAPTNAPAIGGGRQASLGYGFRNRFAVPSKAEAAAKLESLKNLRRPVTLQEFLGGSIESIGIDHYDKPIDSFERAMALTRELLGSIVLSPEYRSTPFYDGFRWGEGAQATIQVLVFFEGGRIGRVHCDATDDGSLRAGGVHLFFEDFEGTFWWHRWDSFFPRKVRTSSANESTERTGASLDPVKTP